MPADPNVIEEICEGIKCSDEPHFLSAAAAAIVGGIIAIKAYDILDDALDKEEEILTRSTDMVEWFHDHYLANQVPQIKFAMDSAMALSVPAPAYGSIAADWGGKGGQYAGALNQFSRIFGERYCVPEHACYVGHQLASYAGATAGSNKEGRHAELRQQNRQNLKTQHVSAAYRGSITDPGNIFGLMNNAGRAIGGIRGLAAGVMSDAMGSALWGVGHLFGGGTT